MKTFVYLILAFFIFGCSSNELQELRNQNKKLSKEVVQLNKKIKKYDNAIVIPRDSLDQYLMTVASNSPTVRANETATFKTFLVLRKLPNDIKWKWKWKCMPEPMSLTSDGSVYTVTNVYPTSGKRTFEGSYDLTFADGKTKEIPWLTEYEVKD